MDETTKNNHMWKEPDTKDCIWFDFIYLKADQWLPWAQGEGSLIIAKVLKVSFKSDGNVLYLDLSDVYTPVYWIYLPKLIEKKTYNWI